MNHHQLTRAAELAPDCPIIALALMLRIAEMPGQEAGVDELATKAIPVDRVIEAMDRAWALKLANPRNGKIGLTAVGKRLVEAATKVDS